MTVSHLKLRLHMQYFTRDANAISRNDYIAIAHSDFCVTCLALVMQYLLKSTYVPMFVPKLDLIKQGQTCVCPQLLAFAQKYYFGLFCVSGRPVFSSVL